MSWGISGDIGNDFAAQLQQQLRQQLEAQQAAQQMQLAQSNDARAQQYLLLQQEQLAANERDRTERKEREAGEKRSRDNQQGVRRMMQDFVVQRTGPMSMDDRRGLAGLQIESEGQFDPRLLQEPEVKRHPVTVRGPSGQPMRRLVTEDELAGGVEEYRAPTGGGSPDQEWVIRGGKPTPIAKGTAQPGDLPYDAVAARGQSSQAQGPSPYAQERGRRTLQSVDQLMDRVSGWTAGWGSTLAALPQTDARDFKAALTTLKSNIAFNELTQMREASKTGGALGAVSDKETALLESALGALDQAQSPEQLREQLQQIRQSVARWYDAQGTTGERVDAIKPMTSRDGAPSPSAPTRYRFNPATGKVEPM